MALRMASMRARNVRRFMDWADHVNTIYQDVLDKMNQARGYNNSGKKPLQISSFPVRAKSANFQAKEPTFSLLINDTRGDYLRGIASDIGSRGYGMISMVDILGNVEQNLQREFIDLMLNSDGIDFISAAIVTEDDSLPEKVNHLKEADIIAGIRPDIGQISHLSCRNLYKAGARFVICSLMIGPDHPAAEIVNMARLAADKALTCQLNSIVPILQVEVRENRNITACRNLTETILNSCYHEFNGNNILLDGSILVLRMLPPTDPHESADKIAAYMLSCLKRSVPDDVAAVFISCGSQNQEDEIRVLAAFNRIKRFKTTWPINFYVNRKMMETTLRAWSVQEGRVVAAQQHFSWMTSRCSDATLGIQKLSILPQ